VHSAEENSEVSEKTQFGNDMKKLTVQQLKEKLKETDAPLCKY
jgi:hypothetical protein